MKTSVTYIISIQLFYDLDNNKIYISVWIFICQDSLLISSIKNFIYFKHSVRDLIK